MKKEFENITIFLILVLALIYASVLYNKNISLKQDLISQAVLIESLEDTVKVWRDKDSLSHAKILAIETLRVKDFLDIKTKDEEIKELQQLVKTYKDRLKNKGSVTIFDSNTNVDIKTPTKVDTVFIDNNGEVIKKLVFKSEFNLQDWVIGTTEATEDSTSIKLKVKNEYNVIIGEESQGIFKKPKIFVEVINKNPFSETTKLRTYQVSSKPIKKFGVGPNVSYGMSEDFQFKVFLGIGLQYNLIRF